MTEPDLNALTDRLIGCWIRWDHQPGDRARTHELIESEAGFEPFGLRYPQLTRRIQHHRRGQPDLPGRPGHRQAVADAVQSAVNDLVHTDPHEFKEAS